jgi:hypothetical protein
MLAGKRILPLDVLEKVIKINRRGRGFRIDWWYVFFLLCRAMCAEAKADNQGEAEASNVHEGIGLVIECDTSLRMSSRRPELGKG